MQQTQATLASPISHVETSEFLVQELGDEYLELVVGGKGPGSGWPDLVEEGPGSGW